MRTSRSDRTGGTTLAEATAPPLQYGPHPVLEYARTAVLARLSSDKYEHRRITKRDLVAPPSSSVAGAGTCAGPPSSSLIGVFATTCSVTRSCL